VEQKEIGEVRSDACEKYLKLKRVGWNCETYRGRGRVIWFEGNYGELRG
jgi:hypothetical protein